MNTSKGTKRTPKSEITRRINMVVEWTMQGNTEMSNLIDKANEMGWDIGERQLWTYRMKADAIIREYYKKERDNIFGRQMARYESALKRAITAGNLSQERAILSAIDKLTGLIK